MFINKSTSNYIFNRIYICCRHLFLDNAVKIALQAKIEGVLTKLRLDPYDERAVTIIEADLIAAYGKHSKEFPFKSVQDNCISVARKVEANYQIKKLYELVQMQNLQDARFVTHHFPHLRTNLERCNFLRIYVLEAVTNSRTRQEGYVILNCSAAASKAVDEIQNDQLRFAYNIVKEHEGWEKHKKCLYDDVFCNNARMRINTFAQCRTDAQKLLALKNWYVELGLPLGAQRMEAPDIQAKLMAALLLAPNGSIVQNIEDLADRRLNQLDDLADRRPDDLPDAHLESFRILNNFYTAASSIQDIT